MADNWVSQNRIAKGLTMAEMTKGAQRRSAYVSVAVESTLLSASIIAAWPWWVITILVIFVVGSLHNLAEIGFTSRADNEQ